MSFNEKTAITLHESLLGIRDLIHRPLHGETEIMRAAKRKRVLSKAVPLLIARPGRSVIRTPRTIAVAEAVGQEREDVDTGSVAGDAEQPPQHTKKGTKRTVDLVQQHSLRCLQDQLKLVAQENEVINSKRKAFLQKHADLLGVYTVGLEKISKLTTLTDAPDALLPATSRKLDNDGIAREDGIASLALHEAPCLTGAQPVFKLPSVGTGDAGLSTT